MTMFYWVHEHHNFKQFEQTAMRTGSTINGYALK